MKNIFKPAFLVISMFVLSGCVSDDFSYVNARSKAYYEDRGFQVIGYQGFNMWSAGRCYWYTIERDKTIYESCLMKWGDEVHEYNLRALNAVKGN